ncbi:styrene-oxide isomerase StyC [Rhodococcus sp. JS3073]|uniref:styrene-oxide isomerase StyC n=1 Tax=Rhodococcus sp. JS3073 TaxID=3002901 RepID=UPI00228574AE|nr:hypothetical protein OYT95_42960 [Rhodococcus sp. JS3073]
MAGHGVLMIFSTLISGVLLWIKLLGGWEVRPGRIVRFDIPGTEEGWARAHTGPVLNGVMVIAVAWVMPFTGMKEKLANRLGWIVILDGWSNVLFYFFGNLTKSRALSFGSNRHGKTNIFGVLGLGPAYFFGVLAAIALPIIGWNAIKNANSTTTEGPISDPPATRLSGRPEGRGNPGAFAGR